MFGYRKFRYVKNFTTQIIWTNVQNIQNKIRALIFREWAKSPIGLYSSIRVYKNMHLHKQPQSTNHSFSRIKRITNILQGSTPTLSVIMSTYQVLRLLQLVTFIDKIPLIVGIYIILISMLYCDCTKRKVQPTVSFATSILISPNSHSNIQQNPRRILRAFEWFECLYSNTPTYVHPNCVAFIDALIQRD